MGTSQFRRELEAFVSGSMPLQESPMLCRKVCERLLLSIVERCQEAAHALLSKSHAYKTASGANSSLTLRAPEVMSYAVDNRLHSALIGHFCAVLNAQKIATLWQMDKHPLRQQLLNHKAQGGRPNFDRAIDLIFCSNNPGDRFWRNEVARKLHTHKRKLREKQVALVRKGVDTCKEITFSGHIAVPVCAGPSQDTCTERLARICD